MQRLEVSGAVRLIYRSLGVKGLTKLRIPTISCVVCVRLSAGPRGATQLPIVQIS